MKRMILVLASLFSISPVTDAALARGTMLAKVDIGTQRMKIYLNGSQQPAYVWRVSTAGIEGYRTPTGTFHPIRFERDGYSEKFKAPMPWAVYFDTEGDAVHAATPGEIALLGRPASHGCVRLSLQNARRFFTLAQVNRVTIVIR